MDPQTIRLYEENQDGTPRKSAILNIFHENRYYRFHLIRLRHRRIRKADSRLITPEDAHTHAVFHILLFTDGQGTIFREQNLICQPGQILIIDPGILHAIEGQTSTHLEFFALTFYLSSVEGDSFCGKLTSYLRELCGVPLSDTMQYPHPCSTYHFQQMRNRLEIILDLLLQPQTGQNTVLTDYHLLGFFLSLVEELSHIDSSRHPDPNFIALERSRHFLEQHLASPIAIADLAAIANLSRGHFHRLFRKYYGITPVRYQQNLRISAAQRMLRNTLWPLSEIAAKTGFQNVYYFSKVFKDITGLTPGRYRRQYRFSEDS
ncbi:MAG: AraC family transcriptional regulator [Lentisphaerae bacterium]|nr:MAG: AraC family transcriptional regulator [Lentisphaerota bacterium]